MTSAMEHQSHLYWTGVPGDPNPVLTVQLSPGDRIGLPIPSESPVFITQSEDLEARGGSLQSTISGLFPVLAPAWSPWFFVSAPQAFPTPP